jgi:hypothetical protein
MRFICSRSHVPGTLSTTVGRQLFKSCILIFYYLITLTLYSHVIVYVYHGTREAEGNAHERLAQVLNPQNMYELEQL